MKRVHRVVSLVLLAAALAVWVVVLRPQSLGGSALYIVVRGSSMRPTYETGDLVVVQSAAAYSVGEFVSQHERHPFPSGALVVAILRSTIR